MEIFLKDGDYISQFLLQNEYSQWTNGDKILIYGSPNSGKTYFALEYARYMYQTYGWRALYITSRGFVRRQLDFYFSESVHEYVDFQSYHSLFDSLNNIRLTKEYPCEHTITDREIIIVDESAIFFDDIFNSAYGEQADLLLNYLLNFCEKSIVVFMSSLGDWLSTYVDKYFKDGNYNPAYPILFTEPNPTQLKPFKFIKHITYGEYHLVSKRQIGELLDGLLEIKQVNVINNLSKNEKLVYFCAEKDTEEIHSLICTKESERIIAEFQKQGITITKKIKKEAMDIARINVVLFNNKGYQKYDAGLNDKKEIGEYHDAFTEIISSRQFSAKILVAGSSVSSGIAIEDSTIKHIIIDIYRHSTMYQMAGRVRIASENATIHIRLQPIGYKHLEELYRQRQIIKYVGSNRSSAMFNLTTRFQIKDMQGIVRLIGGTHPSDFEREDNPHIKSAQLRPIYLAQHRVYLDTAYYYKIKGNKLGEAFYIYNMLPHDMQVISKIPSENIQASINWLRENVLIIARNGSGIFADEDIARQILKYTAIACEKKLRATPKIEVLANDINTLDLGFKISIATTRIRKKDQNGKNIRNERTGNYVFTTKWMFSIEDTDNGSSEAQ